MLLLDESSSVLSKLPPNFLHDVEAAGDRLVAKAYQLIQNNHQKRYVHQVQNGWGEYFNRIQGGSFQHRSMAAALRVQHGPGWITTALGYFGVRSELTDDFTRKR